MSNALELALEWLQAHAVHAKDCTAHTLDECYRHLPCSCGLDKAIAALKEAIKQQGEPVATRIAFGTGVDWWWRKTDCPVGTNLYTSAPTIPAGVLDTIGNMLEQAMDQAVSNGANSISMPDEYVELALWLSIAYKQGEKP